VERIFVNRLPDHEGQRVMLRGWVHNLRRLGEINFLLLRDRSGIAQVVAGNEELEPLGDCHVETVVQIEGTVVAEPNAPGGCELHRNNISVISPVHHVLPFEINKRKLRVIQSTFLDHAVVGNRYPGQRAILRLSAGVMQGFRRTLDALDFVEIQTPKLVASATEGGANVFAVEYFGKTAYLAQSPQFYKQIMVGVFERVYEVGPVFRAEQHATVRHLNEYVSLDVEFGFVEDHFTVMDLLTDVIKGILVHLSEAYSNELDSLNVNLPRIVAAIPHLHIMEAQSLLHDEYGVRDALGEPDLTPQHERLLGQWAMEQHESDFLFVSGYLMSKRPFYTYPDPKRPGFSRGFDLLFRGTELVTGGQRLHRYEDYLAAARARGYELEPFEAYFEAFKYGMPPHGGFAIGLERFLAQLLELENVRMATLFPRDLNRLTP
jgi:nondiscriminating aspartyl-tRNA synthetase